jgi:uncharacterized secreted protein with C-terminal beta-propeller domain
MTCSKRTAAGTSHAGGLVIGMGSRFFAVRRFSVQPEDYGPAYDAGVGDDPVTMPDWSEDAPPSGPSEPGGEAGRAIDEADIIKRDGDRLYALSALGGLTIVDIADPDSLELLGRHRATATPFEMYVRGNTAFVLYNGYGEYAYDEKSDKHTYYQASYVIALDVTDPAAITERQRFAVQGYIADTRLVGDALYVVAFDDTHCWSCGAEPQTRVMSFNVSSPSEVARVDELAFQEQDGLAGWGRSLSGNDQRLYVSGPQYSSDGTPAGSVIHVIDITDGSGDMEEGVALAVAGQVNSRWQMDEYEGVLRVVSQPLSWSQVTVPRVQTFEVVSAKELNPLGALNLVLPEPETLRSVRFDGKRGYAITFRETDPLFTLDLSDPANPLQAGELEMPGWVYHMEPRGDRVVGLGYDEGNPDGALAVSLFDVSDFAAPTMIERVNFGGDWGSFAEDQDRIHKSFQVLDGDGLILVPFSGYGYQADCEHWRSELSGVQLIEFAGDQLNLAGVASTKGYARRGFIHDGRLLVMSDQRLETFDISDSTEPVSTSKVDLSRSVTSLAVAGESVIQTSGGTTGRAEVEATVSSLDELVALEPGETLTVTIDKEACEQTYARDVVTSDDRAYVVFGSYRFKGRDWSELSSVATLDVSNPDQPKVLGSAELGFGIHETGNGTAPGLVNSRATVLALGQALVFTSHDVLRGKQGAMPQQQARLGIVDLTNPVKPKHTSLALPSALGYTGLLKSGNVIATSHFEAASEDGKVVRFYLDRVDVSDASEPVLVGSVNVPGSLLAYDDESQRALLLDYQYLHLSNISPRRCQDDEYGLFESEEPWALDYDDDRVDCTALRFKLNVVDLSGKQVRVLESVDLDKGVRITSVAEGEDRVFLRTGEYYPDYYWYGDLPRIAYDDVRPGGYRYSVEERETQLLVASGIKGGKVTIASLDVTTTSRFEGLGTIVAHGKKAVVAAGWQNRMSVIDASDPAAPVEADAIELPGSVRDMTLMGDTAILALGEAGVHTVSLSND